MKKWDQLREWNKVKKHATERSHKVDDERTCAVFHKAGCILIAKYAKTKTI